MDMKQATYFAFALPFQHGIICPCRHVRVKVMVKGRNGAYRMLNKMMSRSLPLEGRSIPSLSAGKTQPV